MYLLILLLFLYFSKAKVYIKTSNQRYCCVLERAECGLFHQSQSQRENRIFLLANQIASSWILSANGVPRRIVPLVGGDWAQCCGERGAKAIRQNGRSDDTSTQVSGATFLFTTWHHESRLLLLRGAAENVAIAAKLRCVAYYSPWQRLASVSQQEVCLLVS